MLYAYPHRALNKSARQRSNKNEILGFRSSLYNDPRVKPCSCIWSSAEGLSSANTEASPTQYALLTYGNMPVQPRFRVKFLLKFKYENVVRLAFQKKFYSKTRMDGHITIREKSVLEEVLEFVAFNSKSAFA